MSEFLNYLKENYGEDVSKVEAILENKNKKIKEIIAEAFKEDFANKATAIHKIKNEFLDSSIAPKNIDADFLKEHVDAIVKKVNALDEGAIKIIINNNEAGVEKSSKRMAKSYDDDMDLELESKTPKKSKMIKEKKCTKKNKTKKMVQEEIEQDQEKIVEISVEGTTVNVVAGKDTGLENTTQEFDSEELAQSYADSIRKFLENQKEIIVKMDEKEPEEAEEETPEAEEETIDIPDDGSEEDTIEIVDNTEEETEETPKEMETEEEPPKKEEITEDDEELEVSDETKDPSEEDEIDISWDDIEDFTSDDDEMDIDMSDSEESGESEEGEELDTETESDEETVEDEEEDKKKYESMSKKYVGKLIKSNDSWFMVESICSSGLVCKGKDGKKQIINVVDVDLVEDYEEEEEEEDIETIRDVKVIDTDDVPSDDIIDDETIEDVDASEEMVVDSEEESEEETQEEEEEEITEEEKINNPDYTHWVVIKTAEGDYKIETGWEYREDAMDQLSEVPAEKMPKVFAKAGLKKFNLDPNKNSDWAGKLPNSLNTESTDYSSIDMFLE